MKVFQVKCVIKHLIHVCLDYTGLTDFKFKTKYDALKKQYYVNSLANCPKLIKVSVYGNEISDVSDLTKKDIIVNYNPL